jgi:hypothetical protein
MVHTAVHGRGLVPDRVPAHRCALLQQEGIQMQFLIRAAMARCR